MSKKINNLYEADARRLPPIESYIQKCFYFLAAVVFFSVYFSVYFFLKGCFAMPRLVIAHLVTNSDQYKPIFLFFWKIFYLLLKFIFYQKLGFILLFIFLVLHFVAIWSMLDSDCQTDVLVIHLCLALFVLISFWIHFRLF